MTGNERRNLILRELSQSATPLSGQALGAKLGVSRQVIVQDIALLRTAGKRIDSTNRGYVLNTSADPIRRFKVRHTTEQTAEELNAIVDLGGNVLDVMVNHRTYGVIEAPLGIKSRRDVKAFLNDLATGISTPLMNVTDGYHFHHVSAESEEVLDEIGQVLSELGFIAPLTEFEEAEL